MSAVVRPAPEPVSITTKRIIVRSLSPPKVVQIPTDEEREPSFLKKALSQSPSASPSTQRDENLSRANLFEAELQLPITLVAADVSADADAVAGAGGEREQQGEPLDDSEVTLSPGQQQKTTDTIFSSGPINNRFVPVTEGDANPPTRLGNSPQENARSASVGSLTRGKFATRKLDIAFAPIQLPDNFAVAAPPLTRETFAVAQLYQPPIPTPRTSGIQAALAAFFGADEAAAETLQTAPVAAPPFVNNLFSSPRGRSVGPGVLGSSIAPGQALQRAQQIQGEAPPARQTQTSKNQFINYDFLKLSPRSLSKKAKPPAIPHWEDENGQPKSLHVPQISSVEGAFVESVRQAAPGAGFGPHHALYGASVVSPEDLLRMSQALQPPSQLKLNFPRAAALDLVPETILDVSPGLKRPFSSVPAPRAPPLSSTPMQFQQSGSRPSVTPIFTPQPSSRVGRFSPAGDQASSAVRSFSATALGPTSTSQQDGAVGAQIAATGNNSKGKRSYLSGRAFAEGEVTLADGRLSQKRSSENQTSRPLPATVIVWEPPRQSAAGGGAAGVPSSKVYSSVAAGDPFPTLTTRATGRPTDLSNVVPRAADSTIGIDIHHDRSPSGRAFSTTSIHADRPSFPLVPRESAASAMNIARVRDSSFPPTFVPSSAASFARESAAQTSGRWSGMSAVSAAAGRATAATLQEQYNNAQAGLRLNGGSTVALPRESSMLIPQAGGSGSRLDRGSAVVLPRESTVLIPPAGESRLDRGSTVVLPRESSVLIPPAGGSRLDRGSAVVLPRESTVLIPPAGGSRLDRGSTVVLPRESSVLIPSAGGPRVDRDSTVVLPRESSAIIPGPSEAKGGGGSAGEGSGQIIRESTVVLPRGFSTIIPRPSGLQQVDEGRTFPTSAVEALRRTAESRVNQRQVFQADQDASPDRRISSDGGQREDVRNYKSTSKTSIATRGVSAFSGGGDRADYSYYSRGSGSTAGSLVRNVNDRVEELLQEIGVTLGVPSSAQAHPGENIPFTNHVHEPPQLGSVVCNPEGRKSKSPGSDLQDIFVSRPSDYVLQPSDYVRSSTRYASTSKGQQLDAPQLGQVRDQDRDNAGSVFPPGVHASSSPSFSTTAQPHNMVPSAGTVASTDPRSVVVPVEQRADAKKRTSSLHPQHEAGGSSSSVISQDLAAAHKMKGEQQPAYALQLSGPLREVDQQPSQQPRTVIEEPVSPMSTARSGWQWEPAYILRRWSPGGTSSGDFRIVSATTGGLVTHPGFLETHFPSALPVFARDEDDDVLAAPSLQPERFVHQQMASVAQRKGDRLSGNASTAQSKTCVNSAATSLMSPIPRSLQQARDAVKSSRAPAAGGGSSEDVASGIGSIQQESAVEADAVPVVDHYTIHERGGDAATQNIVFNMNRVRPRTSDRDDVQDRLFSPRRREDHLSSRMTASAAARMKSTAMRQEQRRETSNDSARGKRVAPTWSNSTKVMTGVINSHTPMPIGGTSPRGSSRSGQEEGGLSNSNGGGFTPRQQRSLAVQLELEKRRSLLRERRESRGAEANAKASSKRQNARRNGRNLPSSRRPAGSGPTSSTVSAVFNTGTNKPSSTRRKDRNAREGTNALSEITSQQPMTTASTILMKGGAASSAAPPNNRMERGGTRQLAEEEINQGQRQEAQRGDGTQGAGIISMSLPAERPMSKQSIERPPAAKGYSAPAAEFRKFELEKLHPLPHTIAQKSQTQKLSKQDRPVAEHNIDDMERIPIANTSGSGLTPDEKQVASTGNAGDPNYDVLDQLQKTPFDGRVIIRRSRKEVSPNKIRSTARITAAPVMVMKNTSSPSIRSVELSGDEMQRPPHASKSAVTEADDHRLGEGSHKKPHAEKTVAAARLEEDLRDAAAYMFPNRSQREGQHAGAAEEDPGAFLDAELPGASPQTELPFSPPAIVIDSPEHQTMKLEPPLELATHNQKLVPQEELSWRKQGEAKEQRQNPSTNYNFYPEKILESHMRLLDLLDVAARDEVQQIEARIDDHAVANTAHHARRFNSTTKAKNRNRGRSPSENELRAKLGGRGSGSQLLASQDPAVSGAPTAAESLAASDATVPSLLVGDPVLQQEWHNLVKEVHALQASCSVTAPDPAPAAQLPSNQLRSISKTSSRDDTTIGAPSSSKRGRSRSRCTKSTASRFPPGRFIPLGEMKA